MIKIDIDVDLGSTIATLDGMIARSKNFAPTFKFAQARLQKANALNFTTGGLPVGGWNPRSSPAPWPLMRRGGALMGSLTSLVGSPNEIRATSAQFGTDVEYAKFHQSGTSKMPARKIVFEPKGFAEEVGIHAANHILGMGRYFQ